MLGLRKVGIPFWLARPACVLECRFVTEIETATMTAIRITNAMPTSA